ncbi:hypothetical protein C8R45DRAFT_939628 [Mycena sanguinolenta]|nr:hypothetical protein C8R45DRAFT_939628 [Mycena sanguinolenta]
MVHADISQDADPVEARISAAHAAWESNGNLEGREREMLTQLALVLALDAGQIGRLSDDVRVDGAGERRTNGRGREPASSFGHFIVQHGVRANPSTSETRRGETKLGGSKPTSKKRKGKLSTKRRDERDSTMNACIASHKLTYKTAGLRAPESQHHCSLIARKGSLRRLAVIVQGPTPSFAPMGF